MGSGEEAPLRLYNTLTRTKEDFVPLDANNVRVYACGPTVYDFAHIGNARPVIVFDVLYRLLQHVYPGPGTAPDGSRVTYVRNITDVDDKINARAARDFPDLPLNDAIRRVTEKTAGQFHEDVRKLACLAPTVEPRATENIAEMQALIGALLQRGNAYEAGGEVLFDTESMPDYGQLSGRNLADNLAGARVAVDAHKKNPADFVLWKLSSDDEPGWDSPWGRGRPGWHIECSAMSERYLGVEFDIHAGGLDLIFPHHENELAQSRCAHGTDRMAQIWMHNGFLQVEGKKMSKSEGNFVTINELLETEKFGGRKWPGEVLRLAMLMTHYREPIDFSVARLEEANAAYLSYRNIVRRFAPEDGTVVSAVVDALADDLNTPEAMRVLLHGTTAREDIAATLYFLGLASDDDFSYAREARSAQKAGIEDAVERAFERAKEDDLLATGFSVDALNIRIERRLDALNAKDFAEADRIRAALLDQGIQLMDSKDPVTGERKTTWEVKR